MAEIKDVIALVVPANIDASDPSLLSWLEGMSKSHVYQQYRRSPLPTLEFTSLEFLVTDDPNEVDEFQPAHDCDRCRAGNVKSKEFLLANPGMWIALGNIVYVEVFPNSEA